MLFKVFCVCTGAKLPKVSNIEELYTKFDLFSYYYDLDYREYVEFNELENNVSAKLSLLQDLHNYVFCGDLAPDWLETVESRLERETNSTWIEEFTSRSR